MSRRSVAARLQACGAQSWHVAARDGGDLPGAVVGCQGSEARAALLSSNGSFSCVCVPESTRTMLLCCADTQKPTDPCKGAARYQRTRSSVTTLLPTRVCAGAQSSLVVQRATRQTRSSASNGVTACPMYARVQGYES